MQFSRLGIIAGALFALSSWATPARANWTLNLGYQNPAVSTYGVNFLYWGSNWAFEAGIGWINVDAAANDDEDDNKQATRDTNGDGVIDSNDSNDAGDDDSTSVALAGDIDLRYMFSSGSIRPYVQGGFGVGLGASVGDDNGAGAGTGGGFIGLGFMLGSPGFYGYASYNIGSSENGFLQAGLGVDI